jgi:hypothetical protein
VGGTVSVIGGGKFGNGALTAAYGFLFNENSHMLDKNIVPHQHYSNGDGEDVYYTEDWRYDGIVEKPVGDWENLGSLPLSLKVPKTELELGFDLDVQSREYGQFERDRLYYQERFGFTGVPTGNSYFTYQFNTDKWLGSYTNTEYGLKLSFFGVTPSSPTVTWMKH